MMPLITLCVCGILLLLYVLKQAIQNPGTHELGDTKLVEDLVVEESGSKKIGPTYGFNCTIGNAKRKVKFLIDTGCTRTSVSLQDIKRLGLTHKIDTTENHAYAAMGGFRYQTVGVLRLPLKTPSGFTLLTEMDVLDKKRPGGLIGLDVLAVMNCSILMHKKSPKLIVREKSKCCRMNRSLWRTAAHVDAKANGRTLKAIIDSGCCRTIFPESRKITKMPLTRPQYFNIAGPHNLRVSKQAKHLKIEIHGCVGYVDSIISNEKYLMVGTDFLAGKRIDFRCGKAYISWCQ